MSVANHGGPEVGGGGQDGTPAATTRRAQGPGREVRWEGASWRERPCGEEREGSSARTSEARARAAQAWPSWLGWGLGEVVGGQACGS